MNLDLMYEPIKKLKMKAKVKTIISAACLTAALAITQSCSQDDDNHYYYYYPNAIVTVKPIENPTDNLTFYMQLDDSTTMVAENISKSPFGDKEVRALTSIEETGAEISGYDKVVHVYAIDSILTKNTEPFTDKNTVDSAFGNDPCEMIGDWMTVVEDGYLTLRVRVAAGNYGTVHRLTLLTGVNPDDPYEVEFRHKIEGNKDVVYGPQPVLADALVAFRLDSLPDTQGETVKLTLRWRSFNGGESTAQFDYCTRRSSPSKMRIESGATFLTNVK